MSHIPKYPDAVTVAPTSGEILNSAAQTVARALRLFALVGGCALLAALAPRARAQGATTPFSTIEAESGTLGGGAYVSSIAPGMSKPTAATVETEASGY